MSNNKSGLWNESYAKIGAALKSLEDAGLTLSHLARLRADKKLAKGVVDYIRNFGDGDIRTIWSRIYKFYFGKRVNFSTLDIPVRYDPNKHFGVIVAKGTTMNKAVRGLSKIFPVSCPEDLDVAFPHSDRVANEDYFIFFGKNRIYQDISISKLNEKNIIVITLLERLLLEIFNFETTGELIISDKEKDICPGSCAIIKHCFASVYLDSTGLEHFNIQHSYFVKSEEDYYSVYVAQS